MTLQRFDEPIIIPPDRLDQLLEDGRATQRLYSWIQTVSARIPVYGTGTPEGAIEADKGRLYVDIDGAINFRVYMKTTNGGNTGWEPISSDT